MKSFFKALRHRQVVILLLLKIEPCLSTGVKLFHRVSLRKSQILSVASVALAWNKTVLRKLLCEDFIPRGPVRKLNQHNREVQVLQSEMARLSRTFSIRSIKCSGRESGVLLSYCWWYLLDRGSVDMEVPVKLWSVFHQAVSVLQE